MILKKLGQAILLVAFSLIAVPHSAFAQTEGQKKQAKEHYEKATRFYDVGKYSEAISEYEAAYLLVEDAALLFNIAQAYRLWDKPEDAIRTYKNYLRRRPEASNRADVEKKIDDLERLLEERRRSPQPETSPPPPPSVTPAVTSPPPTALPTDTTSPPATTPAPATSSQPVVVAGATGAAPIPTNEPQRKWLPYALMGTGGVCLFTAVVAGVVGAQKAKKLEDAAKNREVYDPAVQANGKTANKVAGWMTVLGLAAGGAGGYLYYRDRKNPSGSTATIAPIFSPTYAGGVAQLTF